MSIRFPYTTVLDYSDGGTSSIATGTLKTFLLPQDTDNVVLKLQASITGGGVSAFLQTTDDGGSTWYDLGRTSVISDATGATAHWLSIPAVSAGIATGITKSNSILSAAIGAATASTVGQQQVTGMPILSRLGRVVLSYATSGTSNTIVRVQVSANHQSATA